MAVGRIAGRDSIGFVIAPPAVEVDLFEERRDCVAGLVIAVDPVQEIVSAVPLQRISLGEIDQKAKIAAGLAVDFPTVPVFVGC